MRVHQMTANLGYGDAITNQILEIDCRLEGWGLDSYVYAENIEPSVSKFGQLDSEYEAFLGETGDLLIYHYSIYTSNLQLYKASRNHKVVVYHNITPAKFFRDYDKGLETACYLGRSALSNLHDCDLALGVSEFNRRELVAAGIPEEQTDVLPNFLILDKFEEAERNGSLYQQLSQNGKINLLYVGRVVPNKACEELIKIVYSYRKYVNPKIHLWIVGSQFLRPYVQFLESLVARLELRTTVTFTGRVPLADLCTYYEASDLFLYTSQHEGFGVPLLESMYFDLPILAYKAAAVPETLGSAGVLFNQFSYAEIAETISLLVSDQDLRQQIIRCQNQRLVDFAPKRVEKKLRQVLERVGVL